MTVTVLVPPVLLGLLLLFTACWSWSPSQNGNNQCVVSRNDIGCTRREGFAKVASAVTRVALSTAVPTVMTTSPNLAHASSSSAPNVDPKSSDKQIGIGNDELAQIIARDVRDNQFMVRADLTRSVYDEAATFTDEIDTYALDSWIKGTKRLFVADKSLVELVPDSLTVTDQEARFLFTEYLTFNIPFLLPKVYLSGEVILKRDPATGLITSYRETWDQDVKDVYKSFQFGGK